MRTSKRLKLRLGDQRKKAAVTYTESSSQGNRSSYVGQSIAVILEKHGIACNMVQGFNLDVWTRCTPA
jgi:type I restriction enzyme, R subunit